MKQWPTLLSCTRTIGEFPLFGSGKPVTVHHALLLKAASAAWWSPLPDEGYHCRWFLQHLHIPAMGSCNARKLPQMPLLQLLDLIGSFAVWASVDRLQQPWYIVAAKLFDVTCTYHYNSVTVVPNRHCMGKVRCLLGRGHLGKILISSSDTSQIFCPSHQWFGAGDVVSPQWVWMRQNSSKPSVAEPWIPVLWACFKGSDAFIFIGGE